MTQDHAVKKNVLDDFSLFVYWAGERSNRLLLSLPVDVDKEVVDVVEPLTAW